MLSLEDLFLAGLGFDVAGAILLGRSLLNTATEARGRTGMYFGFNALDLAAAARDRADAVFGIAALVVGFAFQAAGYMATIHGDRPAEGGATRTAMGVVILLAAVACIAAARRLLGWPIVMRRFVVAMAREWPDTSDKFAIEAIIHRRADISVLESVGARLGHERHDWEDGSDGARAFVMRVYGLDADAVEFREGDGGGTSQPGEAANASHVLASKSVLERQWEEQYETFVKPMDDAISAGFRRLRALFGLAPPRKPEPDERVEDRPK